MATLHKVIEETRSIGKWASITIVCFLLILFLARIGGNIKEYFFPTPPPPPTVTYGKLPAILFPENFSNLTFSYTINTVSGALPVLPDRISISPIINNPPNLLALQRAEEKAQKAGFTAKSESISEIFYEWTENKSPFRTLSINILSSNFRITNNSFVANDTAPDEELAKQAVDRLLTRMSLLPNDIDQSKTKTEFLVFSGGKFAKATSQSNANATRIDFFQKDVSNFPIYYPNPPYSTMNFIVAKDLFELQIIQASFSHFSIKEDSSTYPIKTAKEAFSDLENGKGYIASYSGSDNSVQIKNVFLGYYLGEEEQKYLMPIIIFEGDNNFVAYVSAVTDSWIDK